VEPEPLAAPVFVPPPGPLRLHVGCGNARLEGWINIDMQALPAVDVVADVTRGLGFSGTEAVFAEHFIEHLAIDAALDFLLEAHRALRPFGCLRLSTPNLDWVMTQCYHPAAPSERKPTEALVINRGFHGWGHRFLWNREILQSALEAAGFESIAWCRWGESERPLLRGIERHETYGDAPDMPHVLIAEALRGEPRPEALAAFRALIERELLSQLRG
jgi:predicted SAM-dependent methyltransferase